MPRSTTTGSIWIGRHTVEVMLAAWLFFIITYNRTYTFSLASDSRCVSHHSGYENTLFQKKKVNSIRAHVVKLLWMFFFCYAVLCNTMKVILLNRQFIFNKVTDRMLLYIQHTLITNNHFYTQRKRSQLVSEHSISWCLISFTPYLSTSIRTPTFR